MLPTIRQSIQQQESSNVYDGQKCVRFAYMPTTYQAFAFEFYNVKLLFRRDDDYFSMMRRLFPPHAAHDDERTAIIPGRYWS